MKVLIEIDKGPLAGTTVELILKEYRVVGREGGPIVTTQYTTDGDHTLDADDIKVIETHLAKRRSNSLAGGAIRLGTFKRGRDIQIEEDKVSRTHAMFFLDQDGPSVVDLLSTNGTRVNGQKVTDADLRDGDIVNIGKSRFVVHVGDE